MSPATIKATNEPAPSKNISTSSGHAVFVRTLNDSKPNIKKKILNYIPRRFLSLNENFNRQKSPAPRNQIEATSIQSNNKNITHRRELENSKPNIHMLV